MDSLDLSPRLCRVCKSLDIDQISRPFANIPITGSLSDFAGYEFHQSLETLQESASRGSCELCSIINRQLVGQYTAEHIQQLAKKPVFIRLANRQGPFGPWFEEDGGGSALWVYCDQHQFFNGGWFSRIAIQLDVCIPRTETEWRTALV